MASKKSRGARSIIIIIIIKKNLYIYNLGSCDFKYACKFQLSYTTRKKRQQFF